MSTSEPNPAWNRRAFCVAAGSLATAMTTSFLPNQVAQAFQPKKQLTLCAFAKFLQSLTYDQLADEIAELGLDGIEATVRKGGQVLPERVEEDLPKLNEALERRGLKIHVMASDVNDPEDPLSQRVLKTAAELKIPRYRMKYYRYQRNRDLLEQLEGFGKKLRELAALNERLGIQAVYQNHSGSNNVGAPVWDLAQLLEGVSPDQVAVAFDIRHATVEGGLAWPLHFQRIRKHLGAIYVKDFVWDKARRKPKNVPLGEGLVDKAFFRQLAKIGYAGVISLHVEYLPDAGVEKNLKAIQTDTATLRKLLS